MCGETARLCLVCLCNEWYTEWVSASARSFFPHLSNHTATHLFANRTNFHMAFGAFCLKFSFFLFFRSFSGWRLGILFFNALFFSHLFTCSFSVAHWNATQHFKWIVYVLPEFGSLYSIVIFHVIFALKLRFVLVLVLVFVSHNYDFRYRCTHPNFW